MIKIFWQSPVKYTFEKKKIRQNWTNSENFNNCFCVDFNCLYQRFIYGGILGTRLKTWLIKGILLRFLKAGRDLVHDQRCRLKNKKNRPVARTLKPDAAIQYILWTFRPVTVNHWNSQEVSACRWFSKLGLLKLS